MFQIGYVFNELRRRSGRTILTALGLAAGVGLVIGIIGVSQGLDEAQAKVLAPLSSIGTDVLVTRVVGATSTSPGTSPTPSPSAGSFNDPRAGGGFFGGGFGGNNNLNLQDVSALESENQNVVTDLSKLGKPGTKFTHDFFLSATLLSFPDAAVQQIEQLPGVTSATPGLTLLAEHQTGTVPQIVASFQTGGNTVQQNVTAPALTAAQQAAIQACFEKRFAAGGGGGFGGPQPSASPGSGGERRGAFESCLPASLRNFRATFRNPLRTIQQIVNPPQTDIQTTSYNVAGIDPASPHAGLVTTDQLTAGKWLTAGQPNQILVASSYANKNNLKVGSTITINGTTYTVVGLVNPTLTGSTADIYFPLSTLQKMSSKAGRVTQVLVKTSSASNVDAVAAEISKLLPGAQVVTTKSLAAQVTGSLGDAKKLSSRLGGALGVIVLAAAFIIAILLTLSSVAKRVREIGTLRAIGWSKSRVVRQVLAETVGIGLFGGVVGVGIGYAAAAAVGAFTPALTATTAGVPNIGSSSLARFVGVQSSTTTSTVSLHAPVHPTTLLLGIGFAIVGGLLAGAIGGWRAARLAPAEALRNVG
ncbi:MAG TPA: FtsX-like permease family protein [Actinomycetota bacterium]|nr:FtsX-like permease family protein [Actinomycetota bacterium]